MMSTPVLTSVDCQDLERIGLAIYPASAALFRELWTNPGVFEPYAAFVRRLSDSEIEHFSERLRRVWSLAPSRLRELWTVAGAAL